MSIIRLKNGNGESNVYYEFDTSKKALGEGGMGRVFRGIQVEELDNGLRKEREVAIKCLLEDLPEHAIKRSKREASIRLKNDNLVEMIDFVETHDSYATHFHVISELLNGVNLDELLDGNTTNHDGNSNLNAEHLLHDYKENRKVFVGIVFRKILSGIMALHDAGYVHRDIDPSNIMVTSDGKVKLIDFGIAKKVDDLLNTGKSLTSPGQFIGKPQYAAPELLLGDLNRQNYTTDVYALGIVLFQLMTGHLPFNGTHQEIYEKQLHEKLPLNGVKDRTVRKIIEKATEKDQKERYQTAAEFRVDLDKWIAEEKVPKPISKPISKPYGKWIGIVSACLVVIGLVCYLVMKDTEKVVIDPVIDTSKTVVEEVAKKSESKSIEELKKAERFLMEKARAKNGFDILQQLVDYGDCQAIFLMSRLYYDANAYDKEGNEFYNQDWKIMRENCGEQADNAKSHAYLMDAFQINETDTVLLYELGCNFMWKERGGERNFPYAKWCFEKVIKLTKNGTPYHKRAEGLLYKVNNSQASLLKGEKPKK